MNIQNEIAKYEIGLTIGLYSKEEFISWVDENINNMEDPPDVFIDIAYYSSKPIKVILEILGGYLGTFNLKKQVDYQWVKHNLLNTIKEQYSASKNDLGDSINLIYRLSLHFVSDADFYKLNALIDYYDLAKDRIAYSMDEVEKMFLSVFNF